MLNDPVILNDWHAVARASEVEEGRVRAARLLGVDIVLWSDSGTVHAWRDQCRHRGAKLSLGSVQDGCLVCPYHGWRYDGAGACIHVPSHPELAEPLRARADVFRVQLRCGLVWVSLGAPSHGVPTPPEWDNPSFRTVVSGPYRFRAWGTRVLENFLDVGHYPFVHGAPQPDPGRLAMGDYRVEEGPGGPVARDIRVRRVWRDGPDGTGEVDVLYTYRVLRPLAGSFTKSHAGEKFSMMDAVTPVDEAESLVWTIMAVNYDTGESDRELIGYQDRVTGQDVPIVESQRPALLPLEPGAEIHLPSDAMAAAYRRWLRKLGVAYGVR